MYPGMNYPMLPIKTPPMANPPPNLALAQPSMQPIPSSRGYLNMPSQQPLPFTQRLAGMSPSPIRQQIAQQMTMPDISRGTRRTIQPVMPGGGVY